MSYLGSWKIDDALTFPAITHDFATGALTDADAVPAYRVYEDETGTAILTGNMAKLDDASTTGFYSEQITLSAANGLEKGKCYTIYITAAVDSVTGGQHHTFQIEAEVDANSVSNIGSGVITAASIATDAIGAAELADGAITAATFATGAIDAAALAADAGTEIGTAVWATAARSLTVLDEDSTTLDLDTTIRAAVGLAAANLDTQIGDLPTNAELATSQASADDATLSAIAALNNLSAAQVNAEVLDVLATDTYAEPGVGVPTSTTTLAAKINYLYKAWRNKVTQTATTYTLYGDDASTAHQAATVSDDGTTFTKGEVGSG
jgi:hypothetical protein